MALDSRTVFLSEVGAQPHEIESVLLHEGGEWKPVSLGFPEMLHAVKTYDGRVWDAKNGWRTGRTVTWYRPNEMG